MAVNAGTGLNVVVTALDPNNNVVASYSGTVHLTSSDAQAVLSRDGNLQQGAGSFAVTLDTSGYQTVSATDSAAPAITGMSGTITVSPGPTTQFSVVAPSSSSPGEPFTVAVTALDAWANTTPNYAGAVYCSSTDGQANLGVMGLTNGTGTVPATLNTAGIQTITATDFATGAITGTSSNIQVSVQALVFYPTGSMQTARFSHTATLLNDGDVLIAGGMSWAVPANCNNCALALSALSSAELYRLAAGQFAPAGSMSVPRALSTATLLGNGQVLIAGGDNSYGTIYATAELYNPANAQFTLTGSMNFARSGHTATLLTDGTVLIPGGGGAAGTLASAEIYHPTTGTFTVTGSMNAPRVFHTATALLQIDGRVLVAGGNSTGGVTATAELYNPATGTFSLTGSMSAAREAHTATLLTSGAVLVTGGIGPTGDTYTTELFEPVNSSFESAGNMMSPRESHTTTILGDGTVLVTGGLNGNIALSNSELFNPASDLSTPGGLMETERYSHSATLLTTGEVLITGGINFDNGSGLNTLGTAELFP